MDRNIKEDVSYNIKETSLSARRAWIEIWMPGASNVMMKSLSARRAWIEIRARRNWHSSGPVALRKESVDRNAVTVLFRAQCCKSLSARRAWIEIDRGIFVDVVSVVALRKESVDRNPLRCQKAP